jgi:hypothetical protein
MSLQFIGDAAVYFPDRQSIKVNALAGDTLVECYATRDALLALGCGSEGDALAITRKFEERRLDFEIAALVKYRRSLRPPSIITVTAADLPKIEAPTAA